MGMGGGCPNGGEQRKQWAQSGPGQRGVGAVFTLTCSLECLHVSVTGARYQRSKINLAWGGLTLSCLESS